jgi:hypothetical protein
MTIARMSQGGALGGTAGGDRPTLSQVPIDESSTPKWRRKLERELGERARFDGLSVEEWRCLLEGRSVTSSNHDTVLSLDWPHYCAGASEACGGPRGWCYTFTGLLAGKHHISKVAMVDALASLHPALFAEQVVLEVERAVRSGALPYANLRYSGSGELNPGHVRALALVAARGVRLWGFTRNLAVASALRAASIAVIVSYDRSTPSRQLAAARLEGFPLAYSSGGVDDHPPYPSLVVFPLHRSGRVPEVADVLGLCPKVVHEYLHQERPPATCQVECQRCHSP